ncbi:thioredoxin [Patescibacteria group bacterium]|nr:thioredoxin [Patescibacteria group bacterium]
MAEVNLTDQNFEKEVLKSDKLVLVDFFAIWCGPCQIQSPIIEELAKEYKDKVKIVVMDVDESSATAGKLQISSIPTLIIFNKGKEAERLMGLQQKPVLKEKLDNYLK